MELLDKLDRFYRYQKMFFQRLNLNDIEPHIGTFVLRTCRTTLINNMDIISATRQMEEHKRHLARIRSMQTSIEYEFTFLHFFIILLFIIS